jgi:ubiquinone/menaquinone biosynthesis C-methylase UbiE
MSHPIGVEAATAVSMTVGRGASARALADLADLSPEDHVVDVGCGPGAAVREAARRGAGAVGVDPAPLMLALARRISTVQGVRDVEWVQGGAEALPLPDRSATVAWALASAHHWTDAAAGVAEIRRVLAPGGRVLIAERLVRPDARGHAAHGSTADGAQHLAEHLRAAGFAEVGTQTRRAGGRTLIVVTGRRPGDRDV